MADAAEVLARARRGDREAFGQFVRIHQRRVYATALHILGNHGDADDATQETFLRAHRALASFDGRADVATWLYRIAVNAALNTLRAARRDVRLAERSGAEAGHVGGRPEALGVQARDPAERVGASAEVARTLAAIAALSEPLRVTLVLATLEGLPHKQIAEVLGVPEGTVAWRVNEARRVLRERLLAPAPGAAAGGPSGDAAAPGRAEVRR